MKINKSEKPLLILLILFVVLYFFRLGSVGLIDVDEPRYAEGGREMLESLDFIVPYFNYVVRFDKPILFYWLEAFSMKLFGVNEFSVRLPSVLSACLCLGVLFYFIRTFFDTFCGLIGTLILMSCLEFTALSRFSVTDMALTSFISSSILCFFLGYNHIVASHRFFKFQITEFSSWYILAFIFLALAVLTKGPVAIVIVGLVLFPFFWWIRKLDYFFKNISFYLGLVLFLVLVIPWYVLVHFATSGEFTKVFFGLHNLARYTSVVSQHKGSLFYFIPVLLIGFLPWSFFLPQAINSVFKRGLKSLLVSVKDQVPWFSLWWFLIIFLFFSISKTQLLTYILPLFPALSIVVMSYLERIINKEISRRGLVLGLGVFFLFCLVVLYICLFHLNIILPREVKGLKLDFQILFFAFLMLVGVSMAWASSNKSATTTISILLSTFFIIYFCLITFLLPKIDKHAQYLLRTFAKSIPFDCEIATYQIIKPSLTFYAKRQIKKINSIEDLQRRLDEEKRFAFVTKKKLLDGIKLENAYPWGADSRYIFFTNYPLFERSVIPRGLPRGI